MNRFWKKLSASAAGLALLLGAGTGTGWSGSGSVAYANNTTYYVDNQSGSGCSNAGAGTSAGVPWCDFTPVNAKTFQPGDQILLARGAVWNQVLQLHGSGTSGSWITLDAYGSGNKPKIQRSGGVNDRTVYMYDPSYWNVRNLEVANAGDGIRVMYSTLGNQGLRFDNLYIHNIDSVVNASPSTTDGIYYSTGILIDANAAPFPTTSQWVSQDIIISNSEIAYTTAPITIIDQVTSSSEETKNAYKNVRLKNLYIHHAKGPMGVRNTTDFIMMDTRMDNIGYVALPQGTTGIFVWKTDNYGFINNVLNNVPATGSPDETMIDMEGYTNNTYYYGNYISNTHGPGMEFLQLGGGNPPRNPALDHNTNNTVAGNTFDSNNGYAMKTINNSSNPTGTISDNLYYEPGTGLTTGNFSGFTQTNNISISSPSNLYNGGKQYSGTANTGGSTCTTGSSCWSYQSYNGSSYVNLSYDSANDWWGTSGSYVSRFNMLPNATSSNWTAKTWTAPSAGTISLRGRVLKSDISGGDGVKARITKNGSVIWPASGTPQTIAYNDQSGYAANLDAVAVAAGDIIRFEAGNGGSGNAAADTVSWSPTVAYTSISGSCTPGTNLALCHSYSSSSQWDGTQTADKAFDGTTLTNWQSAPGAFSGQWLEVNFGSNTTFDKVILSEYGSRTTGFRIEYWNGSSWATAYTGTSIGSVASPSTHTFAPVTGSKARIYYTSGANTPILYEFEIYNSGCGGPNLTRCKTYSSTSNWDATRTAAQAFDGDYATVWQTAGGATVNGSWVEVNFGANTTFSRAVLSEYGSRTTGYRIEYWNGTSWATAYTGTSMGSVASPSTHTFSAVTGTKARIYFTSGIDIPLIYEFELYVT
ncbi:discoidin domain-containing protein [Paenibacillus sp. BC26]|uniref:discoidin domain-containing protein n=1 Tax=Paenibacillus sp. BC26 TaxID=1881032 RepID=UPI0008E7C120|nr:discoidin domain-containing protein [Paenibacillus sp. BC26]SFS65820.1 F5/8 type C domain-containing protein [Paenibacillus sp. BC26]